jgi:pyruvate kinase
VARFNFSHGDQATHGAVLERFRKVCNAKRQITGTMLDTKGPEIRTAMLRNHESIELEAGQDIIVEAVGDAYTSFEGYKTETETRIGLSYAGLCQSISPGKRILLADGTISIEVVEILTATELRGRVLNTKKLGERKNCNLPGVKVDIPVLTPKDIDDLQNFCCKYQMDFVAASFVQSAEDVQFIRRVLDEAGGKSVKIISKIENQAGLNNFDEILKYTDGVMVARGDLGMEIPSEKVALAQKLLITKCTVAGKFVITATQMLESMITNPLPTRAEMTDVANAVFDGTDAVMLSGETANGEFPKVAVSTMAAIVTNAEHAQNNLSLFNFIRNHTAKPMVDIEAICSSAVQTVRPLSHRCPLPLTDAPLRLRTWARAASSC